MAKIKLKKAGNVREAFEEFIISRKTKGLSWVSCVSLSVIIVYRSRRFLGSL